MRLNQYEWNPESDKIGDGSFAEVFKARDNNGDPVALKIYRSSVASSGTGGSLNNRYSLENEFLKGKHLSHTNVIRYIGLDYLLHKNVMQKEEKFPVLIMEFADAGSLDDRLNGNANTDGGTIINFEVLDETEKISIAKQILAGIGYLHEQGIIHRDLKPANILFKTDRMGRKVVKITDFGISRDNLTQDIGATTFGVGTVTYMAPEQFFQKTYGLNQGISERTDIWAFGIIFYRLFTGSMPFSSQEQITDTEVNLAPVPAAYRNIVKGCLQKHAAKRYASAKDVMAELDKIKPTKAVKPKPTFPVKTIAIIAACIALLIGAGFFVYKSMNRGVTIDYTLIPTIDTATKKWGFLNQSLDKIVIPFKYDQTFFFEDGIAPVELNDKWGAINKEGNIVIPIQYQDYKFNNEDFSDFTESFYFIRDDLIGVKLNGKWGFIDKTGATIISFKYDDIKQFKSGMAAAKLNGKWGFIDKNDNIVVPLKFDSVSVSLSKLIKAELNSKWGFIDQKGNEAISFDYDEVEDFSEGLAQVKSNGKWGFINTKGTQIINSEYYSVGDFHEGLAKVSLDSSDIPDQFAMTPHSLPRTDSTSPKIIKYGFIDKHGLVVVPFKYDAADDFSEDLARVQFNDEYGFINKTGDVVVPFRYDDASHFSEGLARVEINSKWGFIDKTGAVIIPLKYENDWDIFKTQDFSEGLAAVGSNDHWGFIDKVGNEIIPLKFRGVFKSFKNGYALVVDKNSFGYSIYFIDKEGNMVGNKSVLQSRKKVDNSILDYTPNVRKNPSTVDIDTSSIAPSDSSSMMADTSKMMMTDTTHKDSTKF